MHPDGRLYKFRIIFILIVLTGFLPMKIQASRATIFRYIHDECECSVKYDPSKVSEDTLKNIRDLYFKDIPLEEFPYDIAFPSIMKANPIDLSTNQAFLSRCNKAMKSNDQTLKKMEQFEVPVVFEKVKPALLDDMHFYSTLTDRQCATYIKKDINFLNLKIDSIDPTRICPAIIANIKNNPNMFMGGQAGIWKDWRNCLLTEWFKIKNRKEGDFSPHDASAAEAWKELTGNSESCECASGE